MSGKILFGLYFIRLEGFFKNDIEIGRGYCRCGILRARGGWLTHASVEGIVVKDKALVSGATSTADTSEGSWASLDGDDSRPKNRKCVT
jgi:hypothetical protein